MKCFYHGDADGKCAGYWVYRLNRRQCPYPEREFIKINYADRFPYEKIRKDELVYIVDFSITPLDMLRLMQLTKNVVWIDHHANAISRYDNFEAPIDGFRTSDWSGCMLTYIYLTQLVDNDGREVLDILDYMDDKEVIQSFAESAPGFTRLIDDWDRWVFRYGDKTKDFITSFEAEDFDPESIMWDRLSGGDYRGSMVDYYINSGKQMNKYRAHTFSKVYDKTGVLVTLAELYKGTLINTQDADGTLFEEKPKEDFFGWWYMTKDKTVKVSIRSSITDVSMIARYYGGNGHKGAAGFTLSLKEFMKLL